MADHVEIELATNDLSQVNLCCKNRFALHIWPSKEVAERIENATAAASDDGFRIVAKCAGIVGGKVAAAIELVAGKDEATTFHGDVANRGEP